jgi:hypothetical protein
MLVLVTRTVQEDEMYTNLGTEIAAERVADLHRQAAMARLAREAGKGRVDHPYGAFRIELKQP